MKVLASIFLIAALCTVTDASARRRGGGGGWGGGRNCARISWDRSANPNWDCVASYRNNDNLFYREERRYGLRNCYIHTDNKGDHYYYCNLP